MMRVAQQSSTTVVSDEGAQGVNEMGGGCGEGGFAC